MFGGIAVFLFILEHRAHALGALPLVLLLACPLVHLFMHGRHAGHAGHAPDSPRAADRDLTDSRPHRGIRCAGGPPEPAQPHTVSAHSYDYDLWQAVAVNSFVFIAFAFGFARPRSARDWRALGAFSAFVVALFTEMYGFPLTLYFLKEESEMRARFGDAYRRYAERTPRFVPRLLPRARPGGSPLPADGRADDAGS